MVLKISALTPILPGKAWLLTMFLLVAGSQISAQDTEAPIDEITVYGEKRERDLQDTQASVAVLTANELQATFTPDLDQVLLRTPNVNSAFGNSGFVIRGISQNGPTSGLNVPTSNLTMTVTLDDIPLTTSGQTLAGPFGIWDLQQIEIFRGPQSTLQGRNALAGGIYLNSKDPAYEWSGATQAVVGSNGTVQYSGALGGPLIDDRLAFRLSYDHQEADGFIVNPTIGRDHVDGHNRDLLRGKLLFEPNDDLTVEFTGIYGDTEEAARAVFELDTFDATGDRISTVDQPALANDESLLLGGRVDWQLNNAWTLTSLTSYTEQERNRISDGDGTPVALGIFTQEDDVKSVTQELRAVYDAGGQFSFLVGAFYADIDAEYDVLGTFPSDILGFPAGATATLISGGVEKTENYAVFGELEWRINEQLKLIAGVRYDDETIDDATFNDIALEPELFPLPPGTTEPTEASFDAVLPKAQLIYDWNDDLATSLTYQRGYRSGGATFSIFTSGTSLPFDAEFTDNFELAIRSQWLNKRLTINLNAFYIDWTDQQVDVPLLDAFPELADQIPADADTSELTATVNAGESEVTGFELEVDYNLNENITLFASLGYQATEFKDFAFPDSVEGDDNLAGNDFRFAPELSWAMGGAYRHPGGFFLNGNIAYTDGQYADNVNNPLNESDSYILANLQAGYRWDRYTVTLYGNNVFDEQYLVTREVEFNQGIGGTERVYGARLMAEF